VSAIPRIAPLLATTALGLAGCGGSGRGTARTARLSAPPRSVTRTLTAGASSSTSRPPPSTPATTTTGRTVSGGAPPQPPACTATDLGIHYVNSLGAAGSSFSRFEFVNVSARPCALFGFPGFSYVDRAGHAYAPSVRRNVAYPRRIVLLAPARGTSFYLQVEDGTGGGPCRTAVLLRFIPPGARRPEQIAHRLTICRGFAEITAVGASVDGG
jgi:hypothetical protein